MYVSVAILSHSVLLTIHNAFVYIRKRPLPTISIFKSFAHWHPAKTNVVYTVAGVVGRTALLYIYPSTGFTVGVSVHL